MAEVSYQTGYIDQRACRRRANRSPNWPHRQARRRRPLSALRDSRAGTANQRADQRLPQFSRIWWESLGRPRADAACRAGIKAKRSGTASELTAPLSDMLAAPYHSSPRQVSAEGLADYNARVARLSQERNNTDSPLNTLQSLCRLTRSSLQVPEPKLQARNSRHLPEQRLNVPNSLPRQ